MIRKEADRYWIDTPYRYVHFESLLKTDRAIKRKSNWLVIQTAGDNPDKLQLEFEDSVTARRAGGSLLLHIREKKAAGECNTDAMYNHIVMSWLDQLDTGGYIMNKRKQEAPVD